MAQIIAIVSLALVLIVATLVWKSWAPPPAKVSADAASLQISDMTPQSLPAQEIEDRTMVFITADKQ